MENSINILKTTYFCFLEHSWKIFLEKKYYPNITYWWPKNYMYSKLMQCIFMYYKHLLNTKEWITVINMLQFSSAVLKKHLGIWNYSRVYSMWSSDHIQKWGCDGGHRGLRTREETKIWLHVTEGLIYNFIIYITLKLH